MWSKEGCRNVTNGIDYVDCACNHTTSYALLISITDVDDPHSHTNNVLTVLTYVGCAVSLVFLITSFVIFIYLE